MGCPADCSVLQLIELGRGELIREFHGFRKHTQGPARGSVGIGSGTTGDRLFCARNAGDEKSEQQDSEQKGLQLDAAQLEDLSANVRKKFGSVRLFVSDRFSEDWVLFQALSVVRQELV